MRKLSQRWVGLDVHADTIVVAVAEETGNPAVLETVRTTQELLKVLRRLGTPATLHICYEAGPTGFVLQRELAAAGFECVVVAPSKVPAVPGDKVKTDKRDAQKLARFLRTGDLKAVWVPDARTEALRDLSRCRSAARDALHAARQMLSKFLLRHGFKFAEKAAKWGTRHLTWIESRPFDQHAQQLVLQNYLNEVRREEARLEDLEASLLKEAESWVRRPIVTALTSMRGISTLSAIILCVELGDFSRFESARTLMGFVGLVPSEDSSGKRKSRGRITRAGNSHVRHVLVEAAWSYRWVPRVGIEHRRRLATVDKQTQDLAWRAQERLHKRYMHLSMKGKQAVKVVTAIARELLGFVWDIARRAEGRLDATLIPQP